MWISLHQHDTIKRVKKWGIRTQQSFYVTDEDGEVTGEDVALDDSWNYTDILQSGIQAEKVQRAFEKLNTGSRPCTKNGQQFA